MIHTILSLCDRTGIWSEPLAAPLVRCRRCGDAYPGTYFVVVRGVGVCKYCRRWGVPRGKGARA